MGLYDKWAFSQKRGPLSGSEEDAMEHMEKIRSETLYDHECSPGCQRKGNLTFSVILPFISNINSYYLSLKINITINI